jgi:hypothetical protein
MFSSGFGITDKEFNVLKFFVQAYFEYRSKVNDPVLLWEMIFSAKSVKNMKSSVSISTSHWANVKASMIKKNVFKVHDEDSLYINELLIPVEEIKFNFIITD